MKNKDNSWTRCLSPGVSNYYKLFAAFIIKPNLKQMDSQVAVGHAPLEKCYIAYCGLQTPQRVV